MSTEEDTIPFPEKIPHPLSPAQVPAEKTNGSVSKLASSESSASSDSSASSTSSLKKLLAAYEKPQDAKKDAGNKPLDHYRNRLSPWRYKVRSAILPLVRWETPKLAMLQRATRSTALDLYFAMSANLGTHTFYVIMLPCAFWFGMTDLARSLVFVLAMGVYVTGFIKDLLCLPRPLSPPLHRITMSGSAALEYGFPSTHTANAMSVGVLLFFRFLDMARGGSISGETHFGLQLATFAYVFSIAFGRIYCGMHGFLDVIIGGIIGALLAVIRILWGPAIDAFSFGPSLVGPVVNLSLVLLAVRTHPEPVDDCPCFDDAVAFLGVVAGERIGQWRYAQFVPGAKIPYNFAATGITGSVLRMVVGVLAIAIWRPTMKRILHATLPPWFRGLERVGLSMPRKSFTPASQYKGVPSSIEDATFVEPYQISSLFSGLSKAHRSDSVGPQSTADVYESLDYHEYQREKEAKDRTNSSVLNHRKNAGASDDSIDSEKPAQVTVLPEVPDGANLLSQVRAPRVRYDVEVVTKLFVYSGISAIATYFASYLFGFFGI